MHFEHLEFFNAKAASAKPMLPAPVRRRNVEKQSKKMVVAAAAIFLVVENVIALVSIDAPLSVSCKD